MITCFKLIRNIGQFDSVPSKQVVALGKMTLIYAENGRGKTTLAAILRSLATGNAQPVQERSRLGAAHPPHVVIECQGIPQSFVFQNGVWSQRHENIIVYDDTFVDQNVYSGLEVGAEHKQNLHELIIGAKGVALAKNVDDLANTITFLNHEIHEKAKAIPASALGTMSVDAFCGLPAHQDIDTAITNAERTLSAVSDAATVRTTTTFPTITLPAVDFQALEALLLKDLPDLNAKAAERVRQHLASLGTGGEAWVAEGIAFANHAKEADADVVCPFCAEPLTRSALMELYQAYFSRAYSELKEEISLSLKELDTLLGGDALAALERTGSTIEKLRLFWARLCEVPVLLLDTPAWSSAWADVRNTVRALLLSKQASPLEKLVLDGDTITKIKAYQSVTNAVTNANAALQGANAAIEGVKRTTALSNPVTAAAEVAKLKTIKMRFSPIVSPLCEAYVSVVAKKAATEVLKQTARKNLDQYRTTVFPAYEASINRYLTRFNAGFSLTEVKPANPGGRPSSTYAIKINNAVVPLAGNGPGSPCFKTALSAGDRNALALAFFFASLELDPALNSRVVVIDDPVSSLDDGRTVTTAQEIRHLAETAMQVVVLSHSKRFLCNIWEQADPGSRQAIVVTRSQPGSDLLDWSVEQDCVTEYDINHEGLRDFVESTAGDPRQVARAIRPVMEGFLRVAFPKHFKPGMLLGAFENMAKQQVGTTAQILDGDDFRELTDIRTYANRFHHDTNPAWETAAISNAELLGFVRRTLDFARRPPAQAV